MNKVRLDNIIIRRAIKILLDIDGAVNVNIGEKSYLLWNDEKGLEIVEQEVKGKEGIIIINNSEFRQVYSEYNH